MSHVSDLLACENLGRLIKAKRSLEMAAELFSAVFQENGAPCEEESEHAAFYASLTDCGKHIERLMGAVVYYELFIKNQEENYSPVSTE